MNKNNKNFFDKISSLFSYQSTFENRSYELEHIDTGDYTAAEYEGCLAELRLINRWLGDGRALHRGVLKQIKGDDLRKFSLLDIGAGSGELLREAGRWAMKKKFNARLCGLELNARSVQAMKEESAAFSNIEAVRGDAFKLPFADKSFDYAMCSLFAHHFRENEIVRLLSEFARVARRSVFIIDLHRHPIAYFFYTTLGKIVLHNRLVREDGALSILRGFKTGDFEQLARDAKLKNFTVERSFPFRLTLTARLAETES